MTGRLHVAPTYFREATRADEAALTLIAHHTIAEYVVENLEQNYCPMLLRADRPVGFAVCRENTIDLIVIDYAHHRCGFGTRLLEHCEAELLAAYPAIGLQCLEHNEQANRFFRKHGWIETLTYRNRRGARTILYQKLRDHEQKPAVRESR